MLFAGLRYLALSTDSSVTRACAVTSYRSLVAQPFGVSVEPGSTSRSVRAPAATVLAPPLHLHPHRVARRRGQRELVDRAGDPHRHGAGRLGQHDLGDAAMPPDQVDAADLHRR